MELAKPTLDEIIAMDFVEQIKVMCDLAGKINSSISSRYAYWSVNVKLCFWYELGELMRQRKVAPIPQGYKLSANTSSVLEAVKKVTRPADHFTRNFVVDMGFDSNIDDVVVSELLLLNPMEEREKISIPGVLETILSYMQLLGTSDFDQLIDPFLTTVHCNHHFNARCWS